MEVLNFLHGATKTAYHVRKNDYRINSENIESVSVMLNNSEICFEYDFGWKIILSVPPRWKITIFRNTSTANYPFRNHINGKSSFHNLDEKLQFPEPPRQKTTIFTTSSENYNFRNHLDRKLIFSVAPRQKTLKSVSVTQEKSHETLHLYLQSVN